MKVRVRSFIRNPLKYDEKDVELNPSLRVEDAITVLKDSFGLGSENSSQLILIYESYPDYENYKELQDRKKKLDEYNIKEGDVLSLKYTGGTGGIDNRSVVVFAYLGPIIMFVWLSIKFGLGNLYATQIGALFLSNFHYIKRVLESLIDIRGNIKLNFISAFGLVFYYWILYGYLVGIYIFDPSWQGLEINNVFKYAFVLGFFLSEFKNYTCHNILRKLKTKNKGKRGIPQGSTFELVSCANYFWELCSWTCFALLVNVLTAYLFIAYSFISMTFLALEKHKTYVTNFENYPKNRKAIIPFIL